jgi:hypothetical protein
MSIHDGHHLTETEDAAFDSTMKIGGIVVALLAIVGLAFWYFAA